MFMFLGKNLVKVNMPQFTNVSKESNLAHKLNVLPYQQHNSITMITIKYHMQSKLLEMTMLKKLRHMNKNSKFFLN